MYSITINGNSFEELCINTLTLLNSLAPAQIAPANVIPIQSAQPAVPVSVAAPVTPVAPVTALPAVPVAAPAAPTTPPVYTLDQIARAGGVLAQQPDKMAQLREVLVTKFGVQAITHLNPDQYGALAVEMRALGAQI